MSSFPNAGSTTSDIKFQSRLIFAFADFSFFRSTLDSSGNSRTDVVGPQVATTPALNVSKCPAVIEYFLTVAARSRGFTAQGLFALTRSLMVRLLNRT